MRRLSWKQWFPWMLAGGRAVLGPGLVAGAACGWSGLALAGIVLGALLSDIFDGVLARRWQTDTAALRLADSMTDIVFFLCTAAAIWIVAPEVWGRNGGLLLSVLALEAVRLTFDLLKFGKPASYHSRLAKAWGLMLATAAVVVLLWRGAGTALAPAALWMGVACNVEGLLMSLLLAEWRRDVPSLMAAWRLAAAVRVSRRFVSSRTCVGAAVLLLVPAAFSGDGYQVTYAGGTSSLHPGTAGTLDVSAAGRMSLRTAGGPDLVIPYAEVRCFVYRSEVSHHLGVLPALAVGLVRKRERRHMLELQYGKDTSGVKVLVLEVPKQAPEALVPVLQANVGQTCRAAPLAQ